MTDTDLRWQLRQLPREMEPSRDLWPGIAARLERPAARRHPGLAWGLALAASVLVAIVGWRLTAAPAANAPAPLAAQSDPAVHVVQAEERAITLEYRATLAGYEQLQMPAEIQPGLDVLDASARDIRSALATHPDSPRLLQQLQRTYSRRLELTHRAVAG
jgi:hypothetical protein